MCAQPGAAAAVGWVRYAGARTSGGSGRGAQGGRRRREPGGRWRVPSQLDVSNSRGHVRRSRHRFCSQPDAHARGLVGRRRRGLHSWLSGRRSLLRGRRRVHGQPQAAGRAPGLRVSGVRHRRARRYHPAGSDRRQDPGSVPDDDGRGHQPGARRCHADSSWGRTRAADRHQRRPPAWPRPWSTSSPPIPSRPWPRATCSRSSSSRVCSGSR